MAIEPITIQLGGFFKTNEAFLSSLGSLPLTYDVPANRRLTIESVSAFSSAPKGQSAAVSLLVVKKTKPATPPVRYQLPLQYQVRYNPNPTNPSQVVLELWSMNHALRAYIDPGLQLKLDAFRGLSTSAGGGVEVVVTGFLEDVV